MESQKTLLHIYFQVTVDTNSVCKHTSALKNIANGSYQEK